MAGAGKFAHQISPCRTLAIVCFPITEVLDRPGFRGEQSARVGKLLMLHRLKGFQVDVREKVDQVSLAAENADIQEPPGPLGAGFNPLDQQFSTHGSRETDVARTILTRDANRLTTEVNPRPFEEAQSTRYPSSSAAWALFNRTRKNGRPLGPFNSPSSHSI